MTVRANHDSYNRVTIAGQIFILAGATVSARLDVNRSDE